ncbi:Bro-N domain-containing protein [Pseudomonas sp. LA21]|uniref:BRO-N domain-containing protein n=1 Tax=unclassified Pseudomonas TaxID=196821 RepID=UPI001FB67DB6|nr:Bro-N domain-containing protein [Pseudomonas sp. LA21]MCJ1883483.1 Bro-N domain-containing protein [Pseudomonas sp. LA21]
MEDIYVPTHFIRFNRPLRAILIDDEPWFVARDFGLLMGRTKPEGILHLLDEDQRALVTLRQGDCYETQEVISESATYAAYYRYRHPENRQVRRWLTQEVIPTLRDQTATAAWKPRRVLMAWEGQRVSLLEWQGGLWVPLEELPRFSPLTDGLRRRSTLLGRWWR